jgi:AAA family ATP:ADP antiporter
MGSETINVIKFIGVIPVAASFAALYAKVVNKFKGEYIFYSVISVFMLFFALFGFVIYPNQSKFHPDPEITNQLIAAHPHFKWLIMVFSKWSLSIFYIFAELWSVIVLALLFWQFSNSVNTVDQSKRFYALFGIFGQMGLVPSGMLLEASPQIGKAVNNWLNKGEAGNEIGEPSVMVNISFILFFGIMAMIIFKYINSKVIDKHTNINLQKNKLKLGLKESINMIMHSKYIGLIVILLFSYGLAINLIEAPWKNMVNQYYPTQDEYIKFQGNYLKLTGICTVLFAFLGSNIVRYMGWFVAALITPIIMTVLGYMFFLSSFTNTTGLIIAKFMLTDPVFLAINMGIILQVLTKSTKYTLFDSTKEMSYVPLDDELKTKGKAAAELLGTKFGKASSALIQTLLLMFFPGGYKENNPIYFILFLVFTAICIMWILAVKNLSTRYNAQIAGINKGDNN